MLEVLREAVRVAHLDRPGLGAWPRAVTCDAADAMGLPPGTSRLGPGLGADFVLFRARAYSELLSRPHSDRLVVRDGARLDARPPDYAELDAHALGPRNGRAGSHAAGDAAPAARE